MGTELVIVFWILVILFIFSLSFDRIRQFYGESIGYIFGGILGCGCSLGCLVIVGIFFAPGLITIIINLFSKILPSAVRLICSLDPDLCSNQ